MANKKQRPLCFCHGELFKWVSIFSNEPGRRTI